MLSVFRRVTPVAARTMSRRPLSAPLAVRSFSAPVGANTDGEYGDMPQPLPYIEYWTQGFSFNAQIFYFATFLCSISYLFPLWTVPLVWSKHNAIAEIDKEVGTTKYGRKGAVFGN